MNDFEHRDDENKNEMTAGTEEQAEKKEPSEKPSEEEKEPSESRKEVSGGTEEKKNDTESKYEDVCFICRRPESKAGKMYHLPNNICVCEDCMHRTMRLRGLHAPHHGYGEPVRLSGASE